MYSSAATEDIARTFNTLRGHEFSEGVRYRVEVPSSPQDGCLPCPSCTQTRSLCSWLEIREILCGFFPPPVPQNSSTAQQTRPHVEIDQTELLLPHLLFSPSNTDHTCICARNTP